jgi:hypothetical protein
MEEKQKATITAAPETGGKGKYFNTTLQILEILLSGQKVTAVALNKAIEFNDARKGISVLRKEYGYPIEDFRLSDRRKVYYLPSNWKQIMDGSKQSDKQFKLFEND